MPNKTIYVKDEALWARAKKLAGESGEGLSGAIANALVTFVAAREAAMAKEPVHRILIVPEKDAPEWVGFAGRQIGEEVFPLGQDGADILVATAYRTVGGNFVLTLRWSETAEDELPPFYFKKYDHPLAIGSDHALRSRVGEDALIWAQQLHFQHASELATNETWIE